MNEKSRDFLSVAFLLFTAILTVWLGVAGPLFGDRSWMQIWHLMERGQTFIAALFALFAAWLATRPVQKQLAEQRRQSAAAASTMIAKSVLALEGERTALIRGKDDLEGLGSVLLDYDNGNRHEIYQTWPDQAYQMSDSCSKIIAILYRASERNPELTSLQRSRIETISTLRNLRSSIIGLVQIFQHEIHGPRYEDGEEDVPEDESSARRPRVDTLRELWKTESANLA
jgi:hypothetical protein